MCSLKDVKELREDELEDIVSAIKSKDDTLLIASLPISILGFIASLIGLIYFDVPRNMAMMISIIPGIVLFIKTNNLINNLKNVSAKNNIYILKRDLRLFDSSNLVCDINDLNISNIDNCSKCESNCKIHKLSKK